jgi:hypothetical protein
MDDLSLAKILIGRLSANDLAELEVHIQSLSASRDQVTAHETLRAEEIPFNPANFSLSIEFAESSAAGFGRALTIAKTAQHFSSWVEGKKRWYAAAWHVEDYAVAATLADALSGIRNRRVSAQGKPTDWSDTFAFVGCAKERSSAYRPSHFCFGGDQNRPNLWGCVQARLDWTEWQRWFQFGRFEKKGIFSGQKIVWIFDKDRIRHELERAGSKLKCNTFQAGCWDGTELRAVDG